MLPCKQGQRLRWIFLLQVLLAAISSRDWSASHCLRLSYRGPLEEAVCLHMSLYLHRLLPYIKFKALICKDLSMEIGNY